MDDFNKIILDLINKGIMIDEEDHVILILRSLPKSY